MYDMYFKFWDKQKKAIVHTHGDQELKVFWGGVVYADSSSDSYSKLSSRYTPLRCAIHAPKLRDESTGETRQLMEGDVVKDIYLDINRIVFYKEDALRTFGLDGGRCTLSYFLTGDNAKLIGNALIDPSLVADWETLPDWPLLQEREAEWKAAQLKDDREIGYIKKDLAAAKAIIKSTEERIAKLEATS